MKVYIAQLKCPNNHCVLACAGEHGNDIDAKILAYTLGQAFADLSAAGKIKHECYICLATDLNIEIMPTRFATLQEAAPMLRQLEAEQAWTHRTVREMRIAGKN